MGKRSATWKSITFCTTANHGDSPAEQRIIQLVRKAFEQLKNEIAGKEIIPVIQVPCGLNIRSSAAEPRKTMRI